MSYSPQLVLTFTVLGTARDPVLRSAAKPGDIVYVTGSFGGPGLALREMLAGREPAPGHRERFIRPVPRIKEGIWLADHRATSGVDISDGLSSDLRQIEAASTVSMRVDLGLIPALEGVSAADAVASGEEYELAITGGEIDTAAFEGEFALELTRVGVVESGDPGVRFFQDGEPVEVPRGYLHFT
jgi:thiamine-monophosphate kinase